MTNSVKQRAKKIKVVLTDVDGVLTDGGMYYSEEGDMLKKFHTRDGMGVTMLRKNKIDTIIITKEKTKFVKKWSQKMNVKKLFDGIKIKESMIEKICTQYCVEPENLAYIGDDVNDIEIMKKCGLSITPNDAIKEVKEIADYISEVNGGDGVFRDAVDLILTKKFGAKKILY